MATSLLGYTDATLLDDVVDAFAASDGAAVFAVVDRVIEGGHDPRRFVDRPPGTAARPDRLAAVPDAAARASSTAPRTSSSAWTPRPAGWGPRS